jgi:hypothetical protein
MNDTDMLLVLILIQLCSISSKMSPDTRIDPLDGDEYKFGYKPWLYLGAIAGLLYVLYINPLTSLISLGSLFVLWLIYDIAMDSIYNK